ncbi:hypothetical protein [Heyndrickxia oleronia]|jgi:hypothetical protein|uniref:Lipoprotein n=1 Tax=Heyndrickxia oleronia TaxID=38875 RepID=A0AAW6SPC8_9BACI|nr:hypothetical protein [Heyndrickxia oleronia]MDH5160038.1 hypothetical protein [Heyndrickxia oleronia]
MKNKFFFPLIFASLIFLNACVKTSDHNIPIKDYLLSSEQSLPEQFNRSENNFLMQIANTKNESKKIWKEYNNDKNLPEIDFAKYDIYFLGLTESGSCPTNIKEIRIDSSMMNIMLFTKDGECTADARPKNFVFKVDKNISTKLTNIVIIDGNEKITFDMKDIKH